MKLKRSSLPSLAASVALALSTALSAFAGSPVVTQSAPADDSGWTFRVAPYLWATSLDGSAAVHGIDADINVGFDKLVKKMDFGFMAAAEARHGAWGFTADMTYAKLSEGSQTPRGVLFNSVDVTMRQFMGNFLVSYSVLDSAEQRLDLYAGARVNYLETEFNLQGSALPSLDLKESKTWVDPIVGLRYRARISGPWFFQLGGDVGGFDASSKFTWQAAGLVGYDLAKNCSIGLGYRGLGTDYHKGGFKYDVISYGPVLGLEFRF